MAYDGSIAAILSNYDEVLKTYYLPAVQEQLNNDTILADFIDTNEKDVSGKDATILMHYGRSGGTMSLKDGGKFVDADYQKFQTCKVPMKHHYGRVTFSGPTIAATRDEKGSYARVIDTEISGIVTDLQKEVNRQLWGCGLGILARWDNSSSTEFGVSKKYRGNTNAGDGFGSAFGGKYLKENGHCVPAILSSGGSGSLITEYTVGDSSNNQSGDLVVTAVDTTSSTSIDTITATTDPTVSEASGTFYVRRGALCESNDGVLDSGETAGTWRLEMMGLRGIVDNVNLDDIGMFDNNATSHPGFTVEDPLQGLDTDSKTWFKAIVSTHQSGRYQGQRALTLDLMQEMFDDVEDNAGKDYGPNVIITTKKIRRKYLTLMQADRRNVNTMTLDGGWKALDYNGIPLMVDKDAIDGEMYFLTTKDLQIYRMSDYDWMQKDGAVLSRISGYDAYEAVLFRYAEMGTTRRNSQGVICDISY